VPFRPERVLHFAEGVLVVNKPPGIVTHGGSLEQGGDLVTRLSALLRARGHDGYLGVHSRLDVGTSGVLPLVTNRARNPELAREIEQGRAERVYVAGVSLGARARLAASGVLEHRLESDKRGSRVVSSGGELARARYRVLSEQGSRALVELWPETGRLHQLRVQLAALGAPIAGDTLYGGAPAWRLLLHCRERSVLEQRFMAPLPAEFEGWLRAGSSFAPLSGFREPLLDAAALRYPLRDSTNVLRLVNDAGDGLPGVTVDTYAGYCVLSVASDEAEQQASAMAGLLTAEGATGVYLKRRERADLRRRSASELAPRAPIAGTDAPSPLLVREGALSLGVELADGLSTGLFVDQRDNRERVRQSARGKRVLNLFAYTCSFSVAAALGGAARITSVDLAGRALERGQLNFRQNELDPEQHEFLQTDAVRFVKGALKAGRRFGLVILDPPSFATVGRATFRFDRDAPELARHCLELLEPGGQLLCVTNHQKTSRAKLRRLIESAASAARLRVKLRDLPSALDCPEAPWGAHPSKSVLAALVVSSSSERR
jgi:23S rRNA (cytosine1962-C5)-methyltransferase